MGRLANQAEEEAGFQAWASKAAHNPAETHYNSPVQMCP